MNSEALTELLLTARANSWGLPGAIRFHSLQESHPIWERLLFFSPFLADVIWVAMEKNWLSPDSAGKINTDELLQRKQSTLELVFD